MSVHGEKFQSNHVLHHDHACVFPSCDYALCARVYVTYRENGHESKMNHFYEYEVNALSPYACVPYVYALYVCVSFQSVHAPYAHASPPLQAHDHDCTHGCANHENTKVQLHLQRTQDN